MLALAKQNLSDMETMNADNISGMWAGQSLLSFMKSVKDNEKK